MDAALGVARHPDGAIAAVDSEAAVAQALEPPRRSFAGHVLSLGVHVFVFGVLAYLTYLSQGGIPEQVLLIYVSSIPLAIVVDTVLLLARARQKLGAHHAVMGCLNAALLCGVGGIVLTFREQIFYTVVGSAAIVWITRYSPAARYLRPPSPSDLTAPSPESGPRTTQAALMIAGGVVLVAAGIALTALAVLSQAQRPGGFTLSVGG